MQSFLLSDFQIAPIYSILGEFPSILVHCNPGLILVVINFFVLIDAHRVDGCEIHRMSVILKTFAHRNDGVQAVSVPNMKLSGNSTLSCNEGFNKGAS